MDIILKYVEEEDTMIIVNIFTTDHIVINIIMEIHMKDFGY